MKKDCILKRMDRVVLNQDFLQLFSNSEVHHLDRQGSDHSPLHVICKNDGKVHAKPFRFLNFWVNHLKFKETVQLSWEESVEAVLFI